MGHHHTHGKTEVWLTAVCFVALLLGVLADFTPLLPETMSLFWYVVAYATGGYHGMKETLHDMRHGEINIDFLMIAAAIGAAIIGQWLEGAILLFLFSLSGALESLAMSRSRRAIEKIMGLRPSTGRIRHDDGREEDIPVEQLEPGQQVVVKPGEHIPIDGTVVEGNTTVVQAAITGESAPVEKAPGSQVFAATLNENGSIVVRVTRRAEDTTLAKIISLVEKARDNKARTQRFLDQFEPVYAVGVLGAVTLLVLIPWLMMEQAFDSVFYRAMTVLVVASPCALVISTPASILSAIANGARNGILFKGGVYVEQTEKIDIIAFDKTGTLTSGNPEVTAVVPTSKGRQRAGANSKTAEDFLVALAAGVERDSEHHLADAIVNYASEHEIEPLPVKEIKADPGRGISGLWNGEPVRVGNRMMMERFGISITEEVQAAEQELREAGNTAVMVTSNEEIIGLLALADQLRPESAEALRDLRKLGIKKMVMLTGDNQGVADRISSELDLDEVHADLLPEEKVKILEQLKREGTVAMIGDGVNDAPALAVSDLGIAMGAAGTDVALETADVVLMGDDLTKLPYLTRLSRKSKKVVLQNIVFSLAVIIMLLAGVFLVDLPLTLGVIGHEGSTLIVVLNGLRLLGTKGLM